MSAELAAIIAIVVLFFLAILLAAAETAFLRMSRVKALALQEQGDKRAGRLARLLERPERTVNAVTLRRARRAADHVVLARHLVRRCRSRGWSR